MAAIGHCCDVLVLMLIVYVQCRILDHVFLPSGVVLVCCSREDYNINLSYESRDLSSPVCCHSSI